MTVFEAKEQSELEFEGHLDDSDEEQEIQESEKPRSVLVELSQLEKLLQRCPDCERLDEKMRKLVFFGEIREQEHQEKLRGDKKERI
jgi:NAD-dependent SIR2 family protein deacetylase